MAVVEVAYEDRQVGDLIAVKAALDWPMPAGWTKLTPTDELHTFAWRFVTADFPGVDGVEKMHVYRGVEVIRSDLNLA